MIWWRWRLRKTFFKGFISTLIPLDFILSLREFGNTYDMFYAFGDPPVATMFQRIALLVAVVWQIIFVTREARRAEAKEKAFILIVEDNETLAKIYRRILLKADYNADLCTSGYDALTIMNYTMPDLIVADIRLGDMTGVELIHKMRSNGFVGRAIAVSGGFIDLKDNTDFADSLLKPITQDELIAAVRKHLA